jgi:hypothetical protein
MPGAAPVGKPPLPRLVWILVGIAGAAIVAIGVWQIYFRTTVPPGTGSAAVAAGSSAATIPPGDAAPIAVAPVDEPGSAGRGSAPEWEGGSIDAPQIAIAPGDATASTAPSDAARIATAPADAARIAAASVDATLAPAAPRDAAAPADAARVAAAADAGAPTGPSSDSAKIPAPPLAPIAAGDTLSISSTPPGARVFLDGSDTGATPLKLAGSPDKHALALLLAGHELFLAQVDGHGTFQVQLKEVTPTNGPAGIKVLRCKDKDRYYVFIDGKPTGQTCPTERIGCEIGPHTVEVYDVVSETRRKWDVVVKDTRLSFRVRVE